jgi:hypothetical protein
VLKAHGGRDQGAIRVQHRCGYFSGVQCAGSEGMGKGCLLCTLRYHKPTLPYTWVLTGSKYGNLK